MAIIEVKSISEMHMMLGLEPPKHPLITIINLEDVDLRIETEDVQLVSELYFVSNKEIGCGDFSYSKNSYDFSEGTMVFVGPGQAVAAAGDSHPSHYLFNSIMVYHTEKDRFSPGLFFNPPFIH